MSADERDAVDDPQGSGKPLAPGAGQPGNRDHDPATSLLPFEYAVLRIMPRVDRGEFVNGAILLYCQDTGFLGIRIRPDLACVQALWPQADIEAIGEALRAAAAVAEGRAGGVIDAEEAGSRFRWLTAPRSVVVQPGPVHTGVTDDPSAELDRIAERMLG